MPRGSNSALTAAQGPQVLLVVCLVAVGIGNISVPPSIPLLSSLYLPISLALVLGSLLLNLNRAGRQLRYPILVLFVFVSFLPGFFVTSLNPYGETKFLAVVIALLLVISPSSFRNIPLSTELVFKLILAISITTSVLLLVYGQPDVAGRLTLWGLNPIGTGRVAGVGAAILITSLILRWKLIRRWWVFVPAIFVCLLGAVQTGSRGPILSVVISVITVLMIGKGVARSRAYRAFIAVVIAGGAMLLFSSAIAENTRIASVDANGRDALFGAALDVIRNNPIGIGWGNFYLIIPSFPRVDPYTLYPHNILLEIGAEGGWIALGAFALLLIFSVNNSFRAAQSGSYPAAVVLSMLIFTLVNASLSSDFVGNRLLWLSVGLSLLTFPPVKARFNRDLACKQSGENTLKGSGIK